LNNNVNRGTSSIRIEETNEEDEGEDDVNRGKMAFRPRTKMSPIKKPIKTYKPLVLVGPSGAGKSTLVKHLIDKAPEKLTFSVSSTTRSPREGEIDGIHYHFVSRESFLADVQQGLFLEHQEVHGNLYGTHFSQVENAHKQGKICILDIDVKGAL
jgi:guanylate kinase